MVTEEKTAVDNSNKQLWESAASGGKPCRAR